jgi:anti-sigma factor RsiW
VKWSDIVTCHEIAGFLLEYSTGELPADVREIFDRHLSVCPNCREYLALYQTTVALGRHAFDDDEAAAATSSMPEELVAAILASRQAHE